MTSRKAYNQVLRALRSADLSINETLQLHNRSELQTVFDKAPFGKAVSNAIQTFLDGKGGEIYDCPMLTRYEIYGWL